MSFCKHAYLIMAHGSIEQLIQLMTLLDDERNDVYLHIDIKAGTIDLFEIQRYLKQSGLYFIKRRNVTWGGDSQIKLELDMIEEAVSKQNYDYLHLLSGVDFPIKSKEYIFTFFEQHKGLEFVMIDHENDNATAISRCNRHFFFQNIIGRKTSGFAVYIQKFVLKIENTVHYSRKSKKLLTNLRKGPNWFSITGDFAKYVISKKRWILKNFRYTICADEVFLQTVIWMSPFRNKIYTNSELKYTHLRITDWQRGNPYIWKNEDLKYLLQSPYLFARKFSTVSDTYIYDQIKLLNIEK